MFIKEVINKGYKAQKCDICHSKFGLLLTRIHKCKRCYRFICSTCGKSKDFILTTQGKVSDKTHRICVLCKQDLQQMTMAISKYDMKWAITSNFSFTWLSKINIVQTEREDYNHYLKLFYEHKQIYNESLEIIQKDVLLGRTDYTVFNYSLKQLFFNLQLGIDCQQSRRSIANVLCAITTKYNNLGYCQGMSGIAAFLLCFGSESNAFHIFCDLIQNIIPQNLYCKSDKGTNLIGLLAQSHFLKQYFLLYMKDCRKKQLNSIQKDTFRTILEVMSTKCLLTLFVSNFSFSNLMFLWEELKRLRSFQVIQRAMLAVVYLFQQRITGSSSQFKQFQKFMELLDKSQFKQIYEQIEIDSTIRKNLINQFYEDFSTEWNTKNNQKTLKKLVGMGKFTYQELELIQIQFLQLLQKYKTKKTGIDKNTFVKLMNKFYKKTESSNYKSVDNLQNLFHVFDGQKNGLLDFRQFICCISIALRGNLKQKIIVLIESIQGQNGYISHQKFQIVLNRIYTMIQSCISQEIDLIQMKQQFHQRINIYYLNQEKVTISELYIMVNDPFINQLTLRAVRSNPQGMAQALASILKQITNEIIQ